MFAEANCRLFCKHRRGLRLHAVAAVPDRAHGVDHRAGRQIAGNSNYRMPGRAFALLLQHLLASRQQRGTGRPVDGPVYSATTQQRGFAALTITSTSSVVISPRITSGLTAISPPVGIACGYGFLPILGHSRLREQDYRFVR